MQAWYEEGFEGAFGGAEFHSLDGPTIDGRIVRWYIDSGSADLERAVDPFRRASQVSPT